MTFLSNSNPIRTCLLPHDKLESLRSCWSKLVFRRIKKISFSHSLSSKSPDFYGFTVRDIVRSNDPFENREIFFSSSSYDPLVSSPPSPGDLICGLVDSTFRGLSFSHWFTCPYDFLYLWTLVISPSHPSLFSGIHPKSIDQILSELSPPYRQFASLLFLPHNSPPLNI